MAKKRIKIKYTNLFLLIVIIYIIIQIVIWTIGYFTPTMVLEDEDIDLYVTKKGLVVMEETIIKSNEDGIIKYNISSDEKIQKDKLIFTISRSNQNEEISAQIESLKNEIKELEKKANSINSNIILNKKEELKILENKKQIYYTDYKSQISGVTSFKYDNNAEKITVDQIDDIESDMLDSIHNNFIQINTNERKVCSSDTVLRIINPNNIYICIFKDKQDKRFTEKQSVYILINGVQISGKVEQIYEKDNEDVVSIKIMEQNASIYNTRLQEFDIIYKKIQGFKIPVESVVEKNNNLGIYVVNEENSMPEFVNIGKNYYKDAKYYYVDYNKNKDENNLSLYDRILLYPNFINKNIKVSR